MASERSVVQQLRSANQRLKLFSGLMAGGVVLVVATGQVAPAPATHSFPVAVPVQGVNAEGYVVLLRDDGQVYVVDKHSVRQPAGSEILRK